MAIARLCCRIAVPAIALLGAIALTACAKKPTAEECRAGITRMMEIQIDETTARMPAPPGGDQDRTQAATWLKSQIPSMLTPQFISMCVERAKKSDLQCTLTAKSTDQLVNECHWKPVAGPKGGALGF